jgi:hypothetical protein
LKKEKNLLAQINKKDIEDTKSFQLVMELNQAKVLKTFSLIQDIPELEKNMVSFLQKVLIF